MKFEAVVEKYSRLAYKISIDMLSSPEDAKDIVQDSYLSLYTHYNKYGKLSENEIKNILCKIVLNKCKDYLKSKKRKENTDLEDISNKEEYSSLDNIEETVILSENSSYINEAVSSLKSPYKEVLTLYYINEYSLDEVATKLNSSKGTIKMQISRAKKVLKEKIGKEQMNL